MQKRGASRRCHRAVLRMKWVNSCEHALVSCIIALWGGGPDFGMAQLGPESPGGGRDQLESKIWNRLVKLLLSLINLGV